MQLTVYDFLYSDVDPVWQKIEVCKKTKRHISEMVFMCIKMYLIYMKLLLKICMNRLKLSVRVMKR